MVGAEVEARARAEVRVRWERAKMERRGSLIVGD